jgi:SAM-dependent methyltransferase
MLVTSRSTAEYRAMFDLAPGDLPQGAPAPEDLALEDVPQGDLAGPVLDCGAGGSSFAADADGRVVAVDPAYALGRRALAARVRAGLRDGDRIIDAHADRFDWGWYGDPARRSQMRRAAAERFLADVRERPHRYLAGALPHLPLTSGRFDLVLCSHLLFTWSDRLDKDWHRRAIDELVRVARRQVRIFPLVVQATAEPVAFLDALRRELRAAGHRSEVRRVPYRFQRGADGMLVIDVGRADGRPRGASSR